ncbi:MAG: type IX secretion system protein PorQ [Prevotella sp.]|nr:type IX secretion system protein PorQ [Prevotella sp.]
MKKAFFTLALLLSAAFVAAQESKTAYNFLRLPVSAHEAALGGENISIIADDASMIFSNPALLSNVADKTIGLNYMNYMEGVNTASATFNRVVGDKAAWAVSGQFLGYGTMREVDENNVQTGEFSAKDFALSGYFSYFLTERITGGITAKFIYSNIGSYNSAAVGVDLGLNYYNPENEWSLSLVAKNLGGQIDAFDDEYDRMPFDLQAGVSKRLVHTPLRFSATFHDLGHWDYKFIKHVALGADLLLSEQIWVGVGYNFQRARQMSILSSIDQEESSHGAGFTLGAGLSLQRFKLGVAYGKYHVSSGSILVNAAYSL